MKNISQLELTDKAALAFLRECAKDDRRVFYSPHARQRMRERKITPTQVLTCLARGQITEPPHRDIRGDWKLTVAHYTAGAHVHVAVAIKYNEKGERAVIVTVF